MKNKRIILIKSCTLLFVAAIIALGSYGGYSILHQSAVSTASQPYPHTGSLQLEVLDGMTQHPLEDVIIVIPETGEKYTTNAEGKTPVIQVPIIENETYRDILAQPWGEITVLAYKDGYIPYALFHTQIWENEARQGPQLLLFPQDSSDSDQPFSIVEGPQRIWVNDLIERFNPLTQ